ncbi:recombinase family protein [Hymenobacter sp. DG01]|uniref:recombinase family protein n=1 Tax=Hymenobacter sp. DG01 TaxID=2584940 RepID=UPI00112273B1|nr:recombinase family protein [Hymenobacter sp. DG01]
MHSPTKKYVTYFRVSTTKQGISGLGIEAQRNAVRAFVQDPTQVLAEFTEVESGKNNQRPQLQAAIETARKQGATLLIAKLDRLSRNAGFIFALRDAGVDFICCDIPDANTLTVGLFAVIAQHERETISKRTKDALAAKKQRGAKLGSPQNLTPAAIQKGQEVRQRNARENQQNRQAMMLSTLLHKQGHTLTSIAEQLNAVGCRTRRGNQFYHSSVRILLNRALES